MTHTKARPPDPHVQTHAGIPPHMLRYLREEMHERGFSDAQWLPGAELNLHQLLAHDSRLTYQQSRLILLKALALAKDDSLGFAVGHRQSFTSLGLVSLGLLTSATGQAALELGVQFHHLTGSMVDLHLQEEDGTLTMVARSRHEEPVLLSFFMQELFASMVNVAAFLSPQPGTIRFVQLMQSKPDNDRIAQQALPCPTHYSASRNAMGFDLPRLQTPLKTADAFVQQETLSLLQGMMSAHHARQTFLKQVSEQIRRRLPKAPVLQEVAGTFSMSERSFRRKLAASDVSFRQLVAQVRQSQAVELLLWSQLSTQEIAEELGYGDTRVFRRAFKNWTGQAPSDFKKQQGQMQNQRNPS